jgi:hypothetical protein
VVIKKVGEWKQAHTALDLGRLGIAHKAMDLAVKQEAQMFASKVKENIRKGGKLGGTHFFVLSKGTRYKRIFNRIRARRPLIATKHMVESVKAEKMRVLTYFAGVSSRTSQKAARRAHAAEFGRRGVTIQASRAMIKFLHLLYSTKGDMPNKLGRGGKDSGPIVKVISFNIPKRPFVAPIANRLYRGSRQLVKNRILWRFSVLTANKLTKGKKIKLRTGLALPEVIKNPWER